MRTTIEVTIKTEIIKCDFCDEKYHLDLSLQQRRQLGLNNPNNARLISCVMCNKHACVKHTGQSTEDGDLCIECAKKYKITYANEEGEYGGVGVKDIKTGKWVTNHKL